MKIDGSIRFPVNVTLLLQLQTVMRVSSMFKMCLELPSAPIGDLSPGGDSQGEAGPVTYKD